MKKQEIYRLCDYVLGGDFERNRVIDSITSLFNEKMSRKDVRDALKDSDWYIASKLLNGKREAGKALTELMREVMP